MHLFATSAKIAWDDATTGEHWSLEAPQDRILGLPAPDHASDTPAWVAADQLNELDEKASKAIEEHLLNRLDPPLNLAGRPQTPLGLSV